jgi:hypothetical protein
MILMFLLRLIKEIYSFFVDYHCLVLQAVEDGRRRGYSATRLRQWNWNGQGMPFDFILFVERITLV